MKWTVLHVVCVGCGLVWMWNVVVDQPCWIRPLHVHLCVGTSWVAGNQILMLHLEGVEMATFDILLEIRLDNQTKRFND